jgi:hypothetical protein
MPSVKPMPKGAKHKKIYTSKTPSKKDVQPRTLSTEFVQDSDSEDDNSSDTGSVSDDDSLPENPASSMPKKNSKTNTQVDQSNSSSNSENEIEGQSDDESSSGESEEDQVSSRLAIARQLVGQDRQR